MKIHLLIIWCLIYSAMLGQNELDAHFRINGSKTISIYQGEVIRGRIILSLPFEEEKNRANQAIDWDIQLLTDSLDQGLIRQNYFNEQRDSLLQGKVELMSVDLTQNWINDLELIATSQGNMVSTLDIEICGNQVPSASLGVDQRIMIDFWIQPSASFLPGNYRLRMKINEAESNTCRLTVKNEEVPTALQQDEGYLVKQAHHYYVCRDGSALLQLAEKILIINPESINGHTYLADAHFFLDNKQKSLTAYERALAIFERDHSDEYEQPTYLIVKIDLLKEALK